MNYTISSRIFLQEVHRFLLYNGQQLHAYDLPTVLACLKTLPPSCFSNPNKTRLMTNAVQLRPHSMYSQYMHHKTQEHKHIDQVHVLNSWNLLAERKEHQAKEPLLNCTDGFV